jgi:anti-anti-sigma factor
VALCRGVFRLPNPHAFIIRCQQVLRTALLESGDIVEFSSRSLADVIVAVPMGQIDHANAQGLEQSLTPILESPRPGTKALLLDFAHVDYISSMGLRVLMVAAKQMRGRGMRIAVAALNPVVKEIFDIARFNHVTEVFPSLRAAVEALSPAALAALDAERR